MNNKTQNMFCEVCEGFYVCTSDFKLHLKGDFHKKALSHPRNRSVGKLTPNDLDKLPWKAFSSGKGWWINTEDALYLRDALNNGNAVIGDYKYYLYASNACIGRSLNKI